MKKILCLALLLSCVFSASIPGEETTPSREVLGLRLSMTKTETDARLQEIGKFLRIERSRQEVWEVRDPSFSHVVIGFEKEGEVRFVTAIARRDSDAKRYAYREAGPLEKAKQLGSPKLKNFYYQWELLRAEAEPPTLVIARGRDPKYLATYSLKRTGEDPERAKEDEED